MPVQRGGLHAQPGRQRAHGEPVHARLVEQIERGLAIPGLNAVARAADGTLLFASGGQPPYGTFAERFAAPAAMRFPLPDGAPAEAIAAGINPGIASWLPLNARVAEPGKLGTVLISASPACPASWPRRMPRCSAPPGWSGRDGASRACTALPRPARRPSR
jgi:hypothetical protein